MLDEQTVIYEGHIMAHCEDPGQRHLTREYLQRPGERIYVMHCGRRIPLLASIMGELRPLDHPEAETLPTCDDCIHRHFLAVQRIA